MSRSLCRRIVCTWLAASLLVSAIGQGVQASDDRAVLARAGAHVARYARLLPHLVAEETMTQHLRPRRGREEKPVDRRVVSDLGWVRLDGLDEPLALRDVQSVDREPVPKIRGARRLRAGRQATTDEARALLDAAARYNLAPGSRNINIPTFVFFFLLPEWQPRFSWKRQSPREAEVWEFSFRERERPTVIRTESRRPVFSRGRVWIRRETGEIIRTLLDVRVDGSDYTLETRFEPDERLGMTLPVEMTETYAARTFVVRGTATYENYRRFTTEARVIGQ
ncbi:MAG TPA: hypothetical protein VF198_18280 [Vicinamibacterales bacterium]